MRKWLDALKKWWRDRLTRQQRREEDLICQVLKSQGKAVPFSFIYRRMEIPRATLYLRLTELERRGVIIRVPVRQQSLSPVAMFEAGWRLV